MRARDRVIKVTSRKGGALASWLVRSTPERAVRVRALTGDIVFLGKTLNSQGASLHPGLIAFDEVVRKPNFCCLTMES